MFSSTQALKSTLVLGSMQLGLGRAQASQCLGPSHHFRRPGLGASAEAQAGVRGGGMACSSSKCSLAHRVSCLSCYRELCRDFMSFPGSLMAV